MGKVVGDEVVNCISATSTPLRRAIKELKGYRRLALGPGEARGLIFHLRWTAGILHNALRLVVEPED